MKYNTIIFDFDYTLADATQGIVSSFNHAFNKLGIPECDTESIRKTVGLPLDKAFIELTNSKNEVLIPDFKTFFREKADEVMSKSTVLFEDTVSTITGSKTKWDQYRNCNYKISF